jgi:hypothetical protein
MLSSLQGEIFYPTIPADDLQKTLYARAVLRRTLWHGMSEAGFYYVNLWFESNNTLLIYPHICLLLLPQHVFLVVVTVALLPCDVYVPWYVISIETVMQSCLPHI